MDGGMMSRRHFLKTSAGFLGSTVLASALGRPTAAGPQTRPGISPRRPNIVFVFADQLRACSVGCYGEPEIYTPHMDQLASQGIRFAHAISTTPLSAPYRACVQTGRYATVTGVVGNTGYLPVEEVCIAEVLADCGYSTAFIGKWFLDLEPQGWNVCEDPRNVLSERRQGNQWWLGFNLAHVYYGGKYYEGDDPLVRMLPPGVYEPDFQFRKAIQYIASHRGSPFCLVMSSGIPHGPNSECGSPAAPPGGDYHFPYDPDALTLRPNVDYPNPGNLRQALATYYGMISNFDWNVGRLVAVLDDLGLADDTILAVSSDHGYLYGSHYGLLQHTGKKEIQSESLDVPFILRYPRQVQPGVVDDVFTAVDVMPTLLGLCGASIPPGVMGRDFSPLLIRGVPPADPPWGPVPSTEAALAGMFERRWVGVRTPRYTLRCDLALNPDLLYDNVEDPYQMSNLVDNPDYQVLRDALQADTAAWMQYVQPRA